jgi:hypothetical protein
MGGLAWSVTNTFSVTTSGTLTTVGTFPSGSYGPSPVVIVGWGFHGGWSASSLIGTEVQVAGAGGGTANFGLNLQNIPAFDGGAGSVNPWVGMPFSLDAGGSIKIRTTHADAGQLTAAFAAIVTHDTAHALDHLAPVNLNGLSSSGQPASVSGDFTSSFFGADVLPGGANYDPTLQFGCSITASYFNSSGITPNLINGKPAWSNQIGVNNGRASVRFALWSYSTDTTYQTSGLADGVGFTNGIYLFSSRPPPVNPGSFGTIVGG